MCFIYGGILSLHDLATMDPKISQKAPYVLQIEPGTYAWCSCGHSQKQPYCDGSHKGTEFVPIIEKIEIPKKVAWCGCKYSRNPPFCDGAHFKILFEDPDYN